MNFNTTKNEDLRKSETVSNNDVFNIAISKLAEVRAEIANLKRFEDQYKETIITILAQNNTDTHSSDKYTVTMKQSVRKSFDTKAVKEYLGDKANEFMKESSFVKFDIKENK